MLIGILYGVIYVCWNMAVNFSVANSLCFVWSREIAESDGGFWQSIEKLQR